MNAVLLGQIDVALAPTLAGLTDVVMVEHYGAVVFYGDVQTPAVKASNSSVYPKGAWDLGVSGAGITSLWSTPVWITSTLVLNQKFVAGYDAVCYNPTDPLCIAKALASVRRDGTFDPDDGNQHGTACMGMAAATASTLPASKQNSMALHLMQRLLMCGLERMRVRVRSKTMFLNRNSMNLP